ncbi:MAG: TIM barrel protein [Planctomyces sp.]
MTVSLVEEARQGPFVFHGDLERACHKASELGFDAIELFAPSGDAIRQLPLKRILQTCGLQFAAAGTGAGMLIHRLSLSDPDSQRRNTAVRFVESIIDAASEFGAPAIIGSMQGRWDANCDRTKTLRYLQESLRQLSEHAAGRGTYLLFEPLNRYESNLASTLQQGRDVLNSVGSSNLRLLADLFHMNIEESSVEESLRETGSAGLVGHVHFVDSSRQAAGRGHLNFRNIAESLHSFGYKGFLSAEAFPIPDSESAAAETIQTFRKFFS